MPSFFARPRIGKPIAVAIAAALVLAVAAILLLINRPGGDAAGEPDPVLPDAGDVSALEGADEVHDPLRIVDGAEYDPELFIFRGYERSYVGAVSAAVNWLSAQGSSLDPDYSERLGAELLIEGSEQVPADWRTWPTHRRNDLGISATGDAPTGYGLNASAMAYQTTDVTESEITVVVLMRLTGTSPFGSTATNTVLAVKLVWTGEDWADSGRSTGVDLKRLNVEQGQETSREAVDLGWKQLTR
jgi:hypothetical protein